MITHLISGGQTGADQGALSAGAYLGVKTGGWVPKGWKTDEGPAPWLADFGCQEHGSAQYAPRTIANVRWADATIWFGDPDSAGGRLTLDTVRDERQPYRIFPSAKTIQQDVAAMIQDFLAEYPEIKRLNVAGNRESTSPGIGVFVDAVLREALGQPYCRMDPPP